MRDLREAVIQREMAKSGLRGRIDAMCASCIYDPTPNAGLGMWRQQVGACTVTQCPLFDVRPRSEAGKAGLSGETGDKQADPNRCFRKEGRVIDKITYDDLSPAARRAFDAGYRAFHEGTAKEANPARFYGARQVYLSSWWDAGWEHGAQGGKHRGA